MKVTIIIPNYNGKHFMEPCLQSLSEQTCRDFKVLVVDNASSDGSLEYMSEHYPDIEVISLKKNYGFSKAVNVGIEHSTTPYVILLNNDTTVDTHYVEEMIKAIEKAILCSDLGLNPSNDGKMIRLVFPELTEERRKELVKDVKKKGEGAKVAVRNIRRDANDAFKKLAKQDVSEDEIKELEDQIQKLTDKYIKEVDKAIENKSKEILTV